MCVQDVLNLLGYTDDFAARRNHFFSVPFLSPGVAGLSCAFWVGRHVQMTG